MNEHYENISSNPHQSLPSNLDAEYRIELDQYKEESDSDVSWQTNSSTMCHLCMEIVSTLG